MKMKNNPSSHKKNIGSCYESHFQTQLAAAVSIVRVKYCSLAFNQCCNNEPNMAENLEHDPGIDFTFPFPFENNDVWIWNLLMQTENLSAP